MKIYLYLSYRREINETDVNYTCNLQKVWDSSDSPNGNRVSWVVGRAMGRGCGYGSWVVDVGKSRGLKKGFQN